MSDKPIHIWKANGKWCIEGPQPDSKASFDTVDEAWSEAQTRAAHELLVEEFRQALEEL